MLLGEEVAQLVRHHGRVHQQRLVRQRAGPGADQRLLALVRHRVAGLLVAGVLVQQHARAHELAPAAVKGGVGGEGGGRDEGEVDVEVEGVILMVVVVVRVVAASYSGGGGRCGYF